MTHDEQELPLEQLDQDSPSEQLMGVIRDERACPPAEPDWESIDAELFARIEDALEDDGLPLEQLDQDRPSAELQEVIRDSRESPPPEPEWQRVDAKLFARIEKTQPKKGNNVVWLAFAGALAAAAAAALWLGNPSVVTAPQPVASVGAGWLSEHRGNGEIKIDGMSAPDGQKVAVGNRIEAVGEVGVFVRPERVRWLLESGSVAKVQSADGSLVLALESGAAEAQVIPVPNGEAFAIDLKSAAGNSVRVAVHGTHLRVARTGDHVVVDLTEGVVSIGAPPKRGSTLGELVTAPAHVELDIDTYGALDVQHAANAVRSPASLGAEVAAASDTSPPHVAGTAALNTPPTNPQVALLKPAPTEIAPDPNANKVVAAGIRRCFDATPPARRGVQVGVTGTLKLQLDSNGYVSFAQFVDASGMPLAIDPPVLACVQGFVYEKRKIRFAPTGDAQAAVPFDFKH